MKSNPYEKIIQTIRNEGARKNPNSLQLGEIKKRDPLIITLGTLELDKDDILVTKSFKNSSISKGDTVLMYRINDTFVIIDKVTGW